MSNSKWKNTSLELGSVPCDETCAQVGEDDYHRRADVECRAYIRQLHRHYEKANGCLIPMGLTLRKKNISHEYGTYYEVAAFFNDEDEDAMHASYWLESNLPEKWDDEAREELTRLGIKQ
jgi:hypothetical protein